MKEERLMYLLKKSIPSFPQATSLINLTVKLGYIKSGYGRRRLEKAKRKALRLLSWLTLTDSSLIERELPLQVVTEKILRDDYHDLKCLAGYSPETEIYYSYYRGGRRDG